MISTLISQWLPLTSLLVLAIPLIFHILLKRSKTQQPNHLPPGPPKLPIIGNLHQLGRLPHRSLSKLSNIYGPVMLLRLGRVPLLVASSADSAREILKMQDLNLCTRPSLLTLKRLSYDFLDVAFSPHSEYWKEMRKIFALELISQKRVHLFGPVRAGEVANMVDSILKSCASMRPVDLTAELISLTTRVISRIAFGKSSHGRKFDGGKFLEVVNEATDLMAGSSSASDFFPSSSIVGIVDVVTGLRGRVERCFHYFDKFYQEIIDEHLERTENKGEEEEEEEDIIDVLIGIMRDQSSPIHITVDHIKAILMNIFLAGIDTSAIVAVWAMTELVRNPELMKKAQNEVRKSVGKKATVKESNLDQLHYLKRVVKETLRLHPPGPLLIPRECRNQCKANGYDIRPGTRVMVNVWAIGRDPKYWDKPDEFRPDRFEDSSIDYKGQHFEFLPFGSGRRICPGMSMGVLNVELALANLLYCFDWELPSGMQVEDIDMDEGAGLVLHKKSPLFLVPIKYNC